LPEDVPLNKRFSPTASITGPATNLNSGALASGSYRPCHQDEEFQDEYSHKSDTEIDLEQRFEHAAVRYYAYLDSKQDRRTIISTKPIKIGNHLDGSIQTGRTAALDVAYRTDDLSLDGSISDLEDGAMSLHEISRLMEQKPDPYSPATTEHLGDSRQYWRDIILGVNDGLVSIEHNMQQHGELFRSSPRRQCFFRRPIRCLPFSWWLVWPGVA
jgi:hypothetical protein